jgi:hypothetical protein
LCQSHRVSVCSISPDDKNHKAAEQIAIWLVNWMKKYGVDKKLQLTGGDSTNVKSGIWGGAFKHLEKLLRDHKTGRCVTYRLHLYVPFIEQLAGPTKSDNGFSGPCALLKALDTVTELPIEKKVFKTEQCN